MFLKISQITPDLLAHTEGYFPAEYKTTISSVEGLIGRYIISKYLEATRGIKCFLPQLDTSSIPIQYKGAYWNISHKKDVVFVGIDESTIGVDIETYEERNDSFMNIFSDVEYTILGGKNWGNFYILWTIKESVIKYNKHTLNEMNKIHLVFASEKLLVENGIQFGIYATLEYENILYRTISGKTNDLIYSVCYNFNH